MIVTHGAQQAIRLCAQVLLENGDPVAVENPGYRAARLAFAATGAVPHGIDIDAEGLRSDRLAGIAGCRLAYVTPSHQYPTGVTPRWRGAWSCWSGPSAPTAGSSRTTTTASIATAVRRWRRWPRWTDRAGCSTSGPSARSPSRRCAWATWWSRRRWSSASASGGPSRYAIRRWAPSGSWPTSSPRGISSATSAACAAPPAPAATPCCGAGQRRRVASRCRRWRRAAPVRAGRQPGARAALIAAAAAAGVEVSALSDYWMDDSSVAPDDRAGLVLGFAAVPEARIDEALRALRKAWRREALVGPVVATD